MIAASCHAAAECKPSIPLQGVSSVKSCNPSTEKCIPGHEALFDYSEKLKGNDNPEILNISVHASPWRFYDSEMRILSVEEIAEMVQPSIEEGVKQIILIASWTGVPPDSTTKSLAQKLSDLLNGFPVSGMDGFHWLAENGTVRTTQQAFTIKLGQGPYYIAAGDEILVSMVAGWPADAIEDFIKQGNAEGIMLAGAGWDIFYLCPEKALEAFEAAAKLSHPIAAYNAALMRLERGNKNDVEAATALLSQAANVGDKKAQVRLHKLKQKGQ